MIHHQSTNNPKNPEAIASLDILCIPIFSVGIWAAFLISFIYPSGNWSKLTKNVI